MNIYTSRNLAPYCELCVFALTVYFVENAHVSHYRRWAHF